MSAKGHKPASVDTSAFYFLQRALEPLQPLLDDPATPLSSAAAWP